MVAARQQAGFVDKGFAAALEGADGNGAMRLHVASSVAPCQLLWKVFLDGDRDAELVVPRAVDDAVGAAGGDASQFEVAQAMARGRMAVGRKGQRAGSIHRRTRQDKHTAGR